MAGQTLIGYVETDSNSLFIVDGIWKSSIPAVFQKNCYVEDILADDTRNVLPVYLVKNKGKRYLFIGLDDGVPAADKADVVETENQVVLPVDVQPTVEEEEEEEDEDEG